MSESEITRAERIEADAAPEPRRSHLSLAREDYDEAGGLPNTVAWRRQRGIPEPEDPWQHGQIQCERCEEFHEPHCTHGRQLCVACALWCESCACEEADARAIADQRHQEWYQ